MTVGLEGPLTLDLRNVDQPPEEGWHTVSIERADPGTSQSGNVKIFIMGRDVDPDSPNYEQTIIWNAMLEGAGLPFTRRFLAACGFGVDEELHFESIDALADALLNRELRVKVEHSEKAPAGYNVSAYQDIGAGEEDVAW